MTPLTKSVTRRAENARTSQGRRYVVQLVPGVNESIRIREEGRQKWYEVPLAKLFALGANIQAEAAIRERAAKRKRGRK